MNKGDYEYMEERMFPLEGGRSSEGEEASVLDSIKTPLREFCKGLGKQCQLCASCVQKI